MHDDRSPQARLSRLLDRDGRVKARNKSIQGASPQPSRNSHRGCGWALATLPLALTLAVAGCVLPREPVQGLEISWDLLELDPDAPLDEGSMTDAQVQPGDDAEDGDDDEERIRRTCAGMAIGWLQFDITDAKSPERSARFTYDCNRGTGEILDPDAEVFSDTVFIELSPSNYTIKTTALDAEDQSPVFETIGDVKVGSGITVRPPLKIEPAGVPLAISVDDAAGYCQTLGVRIFLAAPEDSLIDPDPDADALPHRPDLSAAGQGLALPLDGSPVACTSLLGGRFVVPEFDRGDYALELNVNGQVCRQPFSARSGGVELALDLTQPPC